MASSRHLIDPELAPALELMPPYHRVSHDTLADLRAAIDAAAQQQLATVDIAGVEVGEAFAPSDLSGAPPVRVALYRPSAKGPLPALLHIHGGGGVMGRPEMRHGGLVEIARETGCLVASVDYRLAPETPFPGGLEDCFAALRWLRRHAGDLDIDPGLIAVGGESAGGGLAAALAIVARDRGEGPIRAQMLSYPMLDDRTCGADPPPLAGEFVWGAAANRFAWSAVLGAEPGGAQISHYAAPARCQELTSLPPAFIGVGALDLFLDEIVDYARRLIRAGVPVELHVYPGAFHAFDAVPSAAVTQAFKADWRRALGRVFERAGS